MAVLIFGVAVSPVFNGFAYATPDSDGDETRDSEIKDHRDSDKEQRESDKGQG